MDIYKVKEEYDKKYNEELEKTGIFWAFGQEQFEKYRTHKRKNQTNKDNIYKQYLAVSGGGYIHKKDKPKLDHFFNVIAPQLAKEFISKIDREEFILYELNNHECFYTHRPSDAIPSIKYYYPDLTEEELGKVFNKHKNKKKIF